MDRLSYRLKLRSIIVRHATPGVIVADTSYTHELFQSMNGSHYNLLEMKIPSLNRAQALMIEYAMNKMIFLDFKLGLATSTVTCKILDPQPNIK